jgi:hypothetical protein
VEAGAVSTLKDATRVPRVKRRFAYHMVVVDAVFIQMVVTRVLRVHRLCAKHIVVGSGVYIQMVAVRVLEERRRFVLHMGAVGDANTTRVATSML